MPLSTLKPAVILRIILTVIYFSNSCFSQNNITGQLKTRIQTAQSDTLKAKLYGLLAWELKFTNSKEAVSLADKEIAIGLKQQNFVLLADGYRVKALALVIMEKVTDGMPCYDSAIVYAKKAGNLYYQASCYSLMAGMYGDQGDYHNAIELYSTGLELAQKSGDLKMIATLSNNLAETYQCTGRNTLLTQKYFLQALDNSVKLKNWPVATMNSANLAKEYLNTGQTKKVNEELKRTIELLNKDKSNAYQFATNAHILASIYSGLNNAQKAEHFASVSLRIMDSLKQPDNALRPLKELTAVYISTKNIPKAELYSKQLLQRAISQNAKLYIRDGYKALSDVARLKNDPKESLRFYESYKTWNDSVFQISREQSISNVETRARLAQKELEVKYETEKKARENKNLTDLNNNLRSEMIITITVCIVFIFLVALLYLSNRKKNKANAELESEKKIVEAQAKEKEILMREIHHRVKNNLQIISGLLELQKEELTDEASRAAFNEGQSRINSISLIHQNLYQNEDIGKIKFKTFVMDLSQKVKEMFELLDKKMEVTLQMPDNILDIDTAVPMGLIINELLTNSYKYATVKNTVCKITMSLQDKTKGNYIFIYSDSGPGIKKNIDFETASSMGLRLVKGLAAQLSGKATYSYNNGSEFTITFKDTTARKTE